MNHSVSEVNHSVSGVNHSVSGMNHSVSEVNHSVSEENLCSLDFRMFISPDLVLLSFIEIKKAPDNTIGRFFRIK